VSGLAKAGSGLAGQTAWRLARLGSDVTGTADAPATSATTVTYSGTGQPDSAYTLMTALKATPAAQTRLPGRPRRPVSRARSRC
jgi:LytR cell envelope-related transcriptional attenuator